MRSLAVSFLASSILLSGCAFNQQHQLTPEELAAVTKQNELISKAEIAPTVDAKISTLNEAAQLGSGKAYYELARTYTVDKRIKPDPIKSALYLNKADELGNTDATILLSWNTMYGIRAQKDEKRGIDLMKKAAETDVRAKREMGLMYGNLRHPFLDKESRGLSYLTEAYEAGDGEAAYYAFMLSARLGKEDQAEAALKVGAELGQPKALLSVGRDALQHGQFMKARESFLRSALAYDSEAMFELGKGIVDGIFPPTQTVEGISKEAEAYAWLNEASEQKHLQAKEALAKLSSVITLDDHLKGQIAQVSSSIKEQTKVWNPNRL